MLLAASCSSVPGLGAGGAEPAPEPSTTVLATFVDAEDDDVETIADLEEAWASERDRVIAALGSSQYGIDAETNVLNGPGRFEVDFDACPRAWEDTIGVTPTTIELAVVVPGSGPFAGFEDLALGMEAYFDYVNANGGVDGRQIELTIIDDEYDPELTQDVVDELIAPADPEDPTASGPPFYVTTVGSPGSLRVRDDLNDACIPQPFVVSPHPAWADPINHPFTTGFQLSYTTEAILWGRWIKNELPDQVPVRVAALVMGNEFGQLYSDAFSAWADTNRDIVSEVVIVRHDPESENVSPEMAELVESNPVVFLAMTGGVACSSAVREAARLDLTESAAGLFLPSGCRQPEVYLEPAGRAGHGFWSVGGGVKSLNDPQFADETFVRFARETLTEAGLDPSRELIGVGFAQYGWAHVELLRIAASLPGGLTRSNVVLTLRGLHLDHPMVLDTVQFATEGTRDAFFIEGAEYTRYDADSASWFSQGLPLDLNGLSPACSFIRLTCRRP